MATLRSLARNVLQGKAIPIRGGGGGPVKQVAEPNKPLPLDWFFWWDNGIDRRPTVSYILGHGPKNINLPFVLKGWGIFLAVMAPPFLYQMITFDELAPDWAPRQYPPEVADIVHAKQSSHIAWDYGTEAWRARVDAVPEPTWWQRIRMTPYYK